MVSRIDAELLIPGRGQPIRDASVVFDDRAITYVGPTGGAPSAARDPLKVPVVMPGLWECHGHFMGQRSWDLREALQVPTAVAAAREVKNVESALQAGFTSVREVGGIGVYLARVVDEGVVEGPSIYGAGAILSQTGGHGDFHSFPVDWVIDSCERAMTWLCDGVPECLKAVRSQLRLGARVIKICASGGVMSELDHPVHQQFSSDELRAIVEEAGRAERVVAAHCHGKPGIMAAIEAGARTIEHGSYLDEEAAIAMREAGAILVPTRFIVEQILASKDRMPAYAFEKLVALADRHLTSLTIARDAGVRVALGTDIFATGPATGVSWGMNARELVHLVDAGFSPLQAIEAGTATGPETLGPQASRSGLLAEGYDADVIAVASSPLDDVSILADPENVTHVWKAGRLVKPTRH
jgi:imidazolonepropionase-like amidohydrolase